MVSGNSRLPFIRILDFLKKSHEPYAIIASGDCVYKMDYNKVLEYHIAKRADITVVCTTCRDQNEVERLACFV